MRNYFKVKVFLKNGKEIDGKICRFPHPLDTSFYLFHFEKDRKRGEMIRIDCIERIEEI